MTHRRFLRLRFAVRYFLIGIVLASSWMPQGSAFAAASLTITPITWNVIGLDSNNVNVGPNDFPVGVRVCNTGDVAATNVSSAFVWDTTDPYINLRPGTLTSFTGPNAVPSLAAGSCTDFYYEVEITRDSNAYTRSARYHITTTADSLGTVSTTTPRELYVEYLVSQSRNGVRTVEYGTSLGSPTSVAAGGTMTLMVGNTYYIRMSGFTATNGYEQIESFINIPNTIFQVLSVETSYSVDSSSYVSSPNDKLYGDGCKWENDPNSPNYRACLDVGKAGGDPITVTYQVKILRVPSSPLVNPAPLTNLIYDFSGSSYHYNADFSLSTRYAYVVNAGIAKSFSPKTINPGGTSTLTFTVTNPGANSISSVNFTDNLPSNVSISGTGVTYSGCGGSPLPSSLNMGDTSLSFSNITVSGLSTCTIAVTVTSSTNGTYNNTTSTLKIGTTDTGSSASDTLIVSSQPSPPSSCTTRVTLATWNFDNLSAGSNSSPTYSSKASDVSTASSLATLTGNAGSTAAISNAQWSSSPNSWVITDNWTTGIATSSTTPYFEFTLDTSNYGNVRIGLGYALLANGDWGSSTNHVYVYSSADGGAPNLAATISATKGSWQTGASGVLATAVTTGASTTNFRINADQSGPGKTPSMYLDNVTVTGCPRPTVPTMSKSFSPTSVGTGNTSTLTFTLNNPNSATSLTGVSFSDVLPSGLTVTSGSSTACTTGTLTLTSPRTISLSGGTIAASGACTINVTVTGATAGPFKNVSSSISSIETGSNTTGGANVGYGQSSLSVVDPPVIAKSFSANPIFTGNTTTLTFSINNPNTSTGLTGVSFTDTLPSGLTVASSSSSQCGGTLTTTSPSTISLSSGSISGGGSCSFSVTVTGTTTGLKTNTVTVSSTNGGTGNTSSADVLVKDPAPIISLLKQVGLSSSGTWNSFLTVTAGTNIYYRFAVENIGDVALASVSVTDPDVNLAGCSWTDGDGTPLTPPFSLPVADAGDNQLAICVLGPITAVSGSHQNTATVSGTYNSTTVTDTSIATYGTPALTLAKSVAESYFTAAGDVLNYNYLVTNSGYAPLLGPVTVADNTATVTCPAVSTQGDSDDWLDVGESLTCTATYIVTAGDVTTGYVTNTASATASGVTSNTDSKTVSAPPDLTVTKANNVSGSVAQNGTFNWTITTSNSGATGIATFADTQVIISDTLPGASSYYPQGALTPTNGTTPPTGTINCSISGTALSCVANGAVTLPAGASFSVTFAVNPTSAGSLANTATVDPNANITESNEANNTSSDTVTVVTPPSISKNFSPDPIFVNETSTLTFTITNPNTATALTGVGFTDSLPSGLQVASPPNNSISADCGSATFTPLATKTSLTFSNGNIPASGTCTVSVDVTATTTGTKNNTTGNVTSTNGGTGNTASDSLTVNPLIDVSLDKQVSNATPNVGDTVTFTLVIANAGPSTATNIVMTDVVPSGYAYAASSITGGDSNSDANPSTTGLTWTINSLAPSSSVNLTYQATVLATGAYDNYAEITSHTETDSDSTPGNSSTTEDDDDTVVVTPGPATDLAIIKTDGVTNVSVGGTTTYTVRVTNNGPSSVTGAILSDLAATGLSKTAVACSATPGQCVTAPTAAQLELGTFALPALANGQFYEITVTANVTASSGSVTNKAAIAAPGDTTDSNSGNNSADDTDTVALAPSMTLTKTPTLDDAVVAPSGVVNAGDTITYTFSVENTGDVVITNIVVTDPLLPSLSCTIASLAPGATSSCTAGNNVYTLTQADIDAGSRANTATATGKDPGNNDVTDTDTKTVTITQNPAIDVTKTIANVNFVNLSVITLSYSIVVQNTGNTSLNNVQVVDDLTAAFPPPATYAVNSVTSGTFSVNSGFNGDTDKNLLQGTDIMAPSVTGTITLVVTVTTNGGDASYTNTSTGSGTSGSQTVNDSGSASGPSFIDPALTKSVDPTQAGIGDTVTFTITVTNNGNFAATGVLVTDPLPDNLDYVSATSIDNNTLLPRGTVTLIPTRTVQVDIGMLDVTDEIIITIVARVNGLGQPPLQNRATVVADPPLEGVSPDPTQNNAFAVSFTVTDSAPGGGGGNITRLPDTGFAPNVVTVLPPQTADNSYKDYGDVWLEIPRLGVKMPIVGVPQSNGSWDVTWLADQAGWLQGTAFPSWAGNSALTGHVTLSNGKPGPFVNLSSLRWGDQVIVHAYGQRFIYEVRENRDVLPQDISVLAHRDLSWVTLLTCKDYDKTSGLYTRRTAVSSVLIKVEKDSAITTNSGVR